MAHKHQIWSSNKATRSAAGRKWRHVANQQIKSHKHIAVRDAKYMGRPRKRTKGNGKKYAEPPLPAPKPIISIGDIWKNTTPSGS